MRVRSLVVLGMCVLSAAQAALGQAFNVNFAPSDDAPGPSAAYGGAGSVGHWNLYRSFDGTAPLVDLQGTPSAVTLTVDDVGNSQFGGDATIAGGSGDDQALLFGKFSSFLTGGLKVRFDNLPEGVYEVVTYAWNDQVTAFQGSHVEVVDASEGGLDCGGVWTGAHLPGVTYTRHNVGVLTGTLRIIVTEPLGFGGACNGVQIRRTGTALTGVRAARVNIDFSDIGGVPPSTYAAVGEAGAWNVIAAAPSTVRLRDLSGGLTDSLVSVEGGTTFSRTFSPPSDFATMQYDWWDFGDGMSSNTITFTALQPGSYRVLTYATHGGPPFASVGVTVVGSSTGSQNVGGDLDNGTHAAGLTYAEHLAAVGDDGVLQIVVARNQPFAGGVCGVQLVSAGEPDCPCDYNDTGDLTVQDIFDFLAGWFSGDLAADFNQTNDLSVQDIFDFLECWFGEPAGCV